MIYYIKWTRDNIEFYEEYTIARNENEAREKWHKLHISMSNAERIVDIHPVER